MTTKKMVGAAMVAALYTALTLALGSIAFGPLQFRPGEALTVLPFLFPEAIPGLFVGCLLSNIISPMELPDLIFGSLATLAAAFLTARCRRRWLAPVPPVIINAVVIGAMITLFYIPAAEAGLYAFALNAALVGLSQCFSCFGLGLPLLYAAERLRLKEKLYR